MKRYLIRALALPTVAVVALASCGSDESSSDSTVGSPIASAVTTTAVVAASTSPASVPATTNETAATTGSTTAVAATSGGDTTLDDDAPQRIVSLSPSATEMLFAIGAGDQVIAVDDQSNHPEEALAKSTDLSGFTPNVEAIAALEPDLVVHDGTQDISGPLEQLGIATFVGAAPADLDGIYAQIEQLGAATGRVGDAAELVAQMAADIDAAVASVPAGFEVAPRLFHELDSTLFSVNSNTFIGHVYSLFGLQNIADTAEGGSDYPQLSAEFVISQNPDIIFLADALYGESAETVAARPGWNSITAVQAGRVIPVDADVASRWGPRIVEYVEVVAASVSELAVPSGG